MEKPIFRRIFIVFVCVFFIADTVLSFQQFCGSELEGDFAAIVAPTQAYQKVLTDPLALSASLNHESYAAPNRFFVHWPMYQYFHIAPNALQKLGISPTESIYISCGIAKLLVHLLFFVLFVWYISMFAKTNKVLLFSSVLVVLPLLQTCAYDRQMGLVDHSITYLFFYGLTVCLMLLYFFPYVKFFIFGTRSKYPIIPFLLLSCASIVLPLSGALIAGISLIVILIVLWSCFIKTRISHNQSIKQFFSILFAIPFELLVPLFLLGLFSLYSLYVGSFNSENAWDVIPLTERYLRLPIGFYQIIIKRVGFPILIVLSVISTIYICKHANSEDRKLTLRLLRNLSFFSYLFLLLLPLGGYRNYREYIIRVDTFIPVTVCILFYYSFTAILVLKIVKKQAYRVFACIFLCSSVFFTIIDCRINKANECEKKALQAIAAATDSCVELDCSCTVLSWVLLSDCQSSDSNAKMLHYWHVTNKYIEYKHKPIN